MNGDFELPRVIKVLLGLAVLNAFVLLVLLIPSAPLLILPLALIGGALVAGAHWLSPGQIRALLVANPPQTDAQAAPLWWGEVGLILAAGLVITSAYWLPDPGTQLPGGEAEWLTSSARFAASSLRDYGYIPLWQPYLEFGEPLINQPFSFVLNPLSTVPSLLLGGTQGIKLSAALHVLLAGVGGWFLGRMMGLRAFGRALLGLLLMGKGNMAAMIGTGYFQLGVTQAYFPWIVGGAVALFMTRARWPLILTALAFMLMFWAGNIWYTLPMLVSLVVLGLVYSVGWRPLIRWRQMRRLLLAGLFTLGLSAITLLPIFAERAHIGGHLNEWDAGQVADAGFVLRSFFDGRLEPFYDGSAPGGVQFYYSYGVPGWFALLLFLTPPLVGFARRRGRLWLAGALLWGIMLLWGIGGSALFIWLYAHVPLLAQWRFVGRALAVAAFWIAVLVALRADVLWAQTERIQWRWRVRQITPRRAAQLFLWGAGLLAAGQTLARAHELLPAAPPPAAENACIAWLRARYPDQPLSVYKQGYDVVSVFLDEDARLFNIEADYAPLPLPETLGDFHLTGNNSMPEFAVAFEDGTRQFLRDVGYGRLEDSPQGCAWRNPQAHAYAYSVPLTTIRAYRNRIPPELTTPVTRFLRRADQVALWAQADAQTPLVVTAQELAYPGWEVAVDGQVARLEVLGGQIAVLLPPDGALHRIHFRFRPPLLYVGGLLTLLTCAAGIVCLLGRNPFRRG